MPPHRKGYARCAVTKDAPIRSKVEESVLGMGQSARSVPTKDAPIRSKVEESALGMGQKKSARSVATKGATPQPGVEDTAIYTGRIAKSAASNDETWSKANTHDF